MSIEGIVLEKLSALPHKEMKSFTKACLRHAVFHSFLSDDSKQYVATTTKYRIVLTELLKEQKVLTSTSITI